MTLNSRIGKLKEKAMSVIYINAIQVEDCGNGLFAIHLPSRELSKEERAFMARMFPNLMDRAYEVLEQEALLSSLANQEQIITKEEPLNGMKKQGTPVKKSKPVQTNLDYPPTGGYPSEKVSGYDN